MLAVAMVSPACTPATSVAPASTSPVATTPAPEPTRRSLPPTTVFLVRHGEKAQDDPGDPSLSPTGEARAQALASLLTTAGITHFFATEYRRTQATLRPLASAAGREITVIPAGDPTALEAAIRALPAGSVVAGAGHSIAGPTVFEALGGSTQDPMLPDDAYDRLFVVVVPAARDEPAPTLELRYGP